MGGKCSELSQINKVKYWYESELIVFVSEQIVHICMASNYILQINSSDSNHFKNRNKAIGIKTGGKKALRDGKSLFSWGKLWNHSTMELVET